MDCLKIELSEKDIKRFWGRVDRKSEEECWGWGIDKNMQNYGTITIKHKNYRAHRISWFIHNGEIPEGMFVCHKCDHPGCVNPAHLFLGTAAENNKDRQGKGRGRVGVGENQGLHKLTEKQVIEIRQKYIPRKYSLSMLAEEYGVTHAAIQYVVRWHTWKHVGVANKELDNGCHVALQYDVADNMIEYPDAEEEM